MRHKKTIVAFCLLGAACVLVFFIDGCHCCLTSPHFYSGLVYARYVSDDEPALLELYATDYNRGWWLISVDYRKAVGSDRYDHHVSLESFLFHQWAEARVTTNGVAVIPPKTVALAMADKYEKMWQIKINFEKPSPIVNNWVFDTPEYKEAIRCHSTGSGVSTDDLDAAVK